MDLMCLYSGVDRHILPLQEKAALSHEIAGLEGRNDIMVPLVVSICV